MCGNYLILFEIFSFAYLMLKAYNKWLTSQLLLKLHTDLLKSPSGMKNVWKRQRSKYPELNWERENEKQIKQILNKYDPELPSCKQCGG